MTVWYRASQDANIQSVFSGDDGLYTAGRWNHRGRKAIYCSQSIALCTLEWLAHHGLSVSAFSYYRYSIEIPAELVNKLEPHHLPKQWNTTPATDFTRDFAELNLFSSEKILALAIPSVLVPEEFNLVINPFHQHFPEAIKTAKIMGQYLAPTRI